MALQTSGQISLNDIHIEVGGDTGTEVSLNDSDVRALISKSAGAQNAMNEYYGAASEVSLSNGTVINGQNSLQEITVSNYISSGGTLIVPTGWWVWSDNTSTAAMTIDIPCTVINNGKIIGKGGRGAGTNSTHGANGGPAINVTSSGVTITNASGAYIAGGGGGGGAGGSYSSNQGAGTTGGGGGAGGGMGGDGTSSSGNGGGAGGILNATGSNGSYTEPYTGGSDSGVGSGYGGGAGGGGGGTLRYSGWGDGGGGGRILPGSGGTGGFSTAQSGIRSRGGNGGSGGSAGSYYSNSCDGSSCGGGGHGGGGWGASGSSGGGGNVGTNGGSGGAAITGTSRTLSNSGTIYGST